MPEIRRNVLVARAATVRYRCRLIPISIAQFGLTDLPIRIIESGRHPVDWWRIAIIQKRPRGPCEDEGR